MSPPLPKTAAATEATKRNGARLASEHPVKRDRAVRIVGAALAAGILTAADLAAAEAWARSAPAPDSETAAQLRAWLPAPRSGESVAA